MPTGMQYNSLIISIMYTLTGEASGVSKRPLTCPKGSAASTSRAPQVRSSLWNLDDPGRSLGNIERGTEALCRPKAQRLAPFRSVSAPVSTEIRQPWRINHAQTNSYQLRRLLVRHAPCTEDNNHTFLQVGVER